MPFYKLIKASKQYIFFIISNDKVQGKLSSSKFFSFFSWGWFTLLLYLDISFIIWFMYTSIFADFTYCQLLKERLDAAAEAGNVSIAVL